MISSLENINFRPIWATDRATEVEVLLGYECGFYASSYKYCLYHEAKALREMINKTAEPVPTSKYYFGKSSRYPLLRARAAGVSIKRKSEIADVVVCSKDIKNSFYGIYDKCFIFKIIRNEIEHNVIITSAPRLEGIYKIDYDQDPVKFLQRYPGFDSVELLYKGPCTFVNSAGVAEDLENIINGKIKHTMTDQEFDKKISEQFPILTEEEAINILDLINSNDQATISLGIKSLMGYNLVATPETIKYLFTFNPQIKQLPEWNSVWSKFIKSAYTVGYTGFPTNLCNVQDWDTIDSYDKELLRSVSKNATSNWLKEMLDSYVNKRTHLGNLNFDITCTVK